MALKLGTLFYDIDANTVSLRKAEGVVKRTNDRMGSSFRRLGGIIAAVLTVEMVRRTLLVADAMKLLDVRIRNLTKDSKEFATVFREITRISNQTGVAIGGVVSAFQRFSLVKEIIGAGQKEMVKFTETITKLGILSGATAQEVQATSIQIGQAIANNFKSGAQEINSINEQMPQVARAVEKSLGLIAGSFKKEFSEGGRTGKEFFDAILKASDDANKRFENFPLTIERGFNELKNSTNQAIKRLNDAAGVTSFIAENLKGAAGFMRNDFDRAVFNVGESFRVVSDIISRIGDQISILTGLTRDDFARAWGAVTDVAAKLLEFYKTSPDAAVRGFVRVKAAGVIAWETIRTRVAVAKVQVATLATDSAKRLKIAALEFKKAFLSAFDSILETASITFTKMAEGFSKIGFTDLAAGAMDAAESMKTFGDAAVEQTQRAIDAEQELRRATFDGATERIKIIEEEQARRIEAVLIAANLELEQIQAITSAIREASNERVRIFEEGRARLKELVSGDLEGGTGVSLAGEDEDVVSKLNILKARMGDETQAILNELKKRNDEINKLEKIGADERRKLLVESEKITQRQLHELEKNRQTTSLNSLSEFNDQFAQVLEAGGKEATGIMKAIFFAQKAIQVATIIAETQVAAAKVVGQLGLAGIPLSSIIEATGFARAAMVAGLSVGEAFGGGRVAGGQVSPGLIHPVNENGEPEMLIQGSKQFLLPGKGGEIIPGSAMSAKGSGGPPNITIINEGEPLEVSGTSVTHSEVLIMTKRAEDNAVDRVNGSLASGRGSTSNALNTGFKAERNVR